MTCQRITDEEALDALVDLILDRQRSQPVVALTSRQGQPDPALDPAEVRAELGPVPLLFSLPDGRLTRRLADRVTPALGVYGGAARIWWPGFSTTSDPHSHPLIFDKYGVYGSQAMANLARAYSRGVSVEQQREQEMVSRNEYLLATRARDSAEEQNGRIRSQLAEALEENRRLKTQLSEAQEQLRALRKQRVGDAGELVPETPERRMALLLELIERKLSEVGAPADRMKQLSLGAQFVEAAFASTAALDRIAWVAAFVVGRDPSEMAGLELHPLRTGNGGSDPQRVRSSDGAKAWRVSVQRNTPGAPRLHFWRLSGGGVELASIGHHDDMGIPE